MTIAEKLTAVAEGEQQVFAAGKQAEYDAFWDAYQQSGNRSNYEGGFRGSGWTISTFKPKYDIIPRASASQMFRNANIAGDLVAILEGLGITLDLSNASSLMETFMSSRFTRVGVIGCTNTTSLQNMFNGASVVTIDELVLKANGSNTFVQTFKDCSSLENITIEGAIGNNIDFSSCTKLTHDSLMSIINHLQTKTSDSFVLTLGTDNLSKLTDAEKAIATEKGWTLA